MKKLVFVEEGHIKGWVFVALWTFTIIGIFIGGAIFDSVSIRIQRFQQALAVAIPSVIGTYAWYNSMKKKFNALVPTPEVSPELVEGAGD